MSGNHLFTLEGKTALVTGGGSGIGYAIATGLAQAGARVILGGRREDKLKAAVEELRHAGLRSDWVAFSVSDHGQVDRAFSELETRATSIDVLVNNAGLMVRENLADFSEDDWDKVFGTNVKGPMIVAKRAVISMIRQGQGKIINITSALSDRARPTTAAYGSSKSALKTLTRYMAIEWGPYGIQANGICPGYLSTEMTRPLVERKDFSEWLVSRVPAKRWGTPEDLIGTAVFLASAASNFVNGHIVDVDGGLLATL